MAKEFFKELSRKLREAKESMVRAERLAMPSLPIGFRRAQIAPTVEGPEGPKFEVVPRYPAPQAVPIIPEAAQPQIIREQVIEQAIEEHGSSEITEEGARLTKYKPISIAMPKEYEVAMGEEIKGVTKEYIERLRKVDEKKPLISLDISGKKTVVAWTEIKWNNQVNSLVYSVNEPKLDERLKSIIEESKVLLRQKLDIEFTKIRIEKAYEYLMGQFSRVLKEIGKNVTDQERMVLEYHIFRDFIGLSRIEPLLHDNDIEDIHCDGVRIPLFITHRNPLYGEMQTNIIFSTPEELDSFVLRLAQKCGRALSIAEPLLDGALPDGSRVQITYGTDIAMRGSNFTIRKFTEKPITPINEMQFGTASPEILAYLWLAVESGMSILVSGATATGKTSFLNALSMFIHPELKIISIEDTPELRLPHPNWIPEVARTGFGSKGYGEVTMFDLLKSALRQRPNYVIVGEVRGSEAYVMFQGMATGHPSFGTLHADSMSTVVDRLTTEPINIPKSMLDNLDLVIFITLTRRRGEYVRRVNEIIEVIGYDARNRNLITNKAFKWDFDEDRFILLKSVLLDKIREKLGYTIEELRYDMVRRIRLLTWLLKHKINDYWEVAKYIKMFYTNPEEIEKLVRRAE